MARMGHRRLVRRTVTAPDLAVRGDRVTDRVALLTGAVFVAAGLVKFVFHGWELHAFISFGLPAPRTLVILAGVIETGGGVLLLARRCVAPVAAVLAVTMAVAVVVSGIGHGDVIPSLTLAPVLLAAMVYLLVRSVHLGAPEG
jgi:uncharacterized membrane protein YphA (DoxX/SURF4 family)